VIVRAFSVFEGIVYHCALVDGTHPCRPTLEVDAVIRARSHGKKSLDDFARAFFGIAPGSSLVVPYTRAEIVQALNGVQPYDWERFFAQRVDSVRTEAPVAGIEEAGWSLAWRDSSVPIGRRSSRKRERCWTTIGRMPRWPGRSMCMATGEPASGLPRR
jgi:hypothetical protein